MIIWQTVHPVLLFNLPHPKCCPQPTRSGFPFSLCHSHSYLGVFLTFCSQWLWWQWILGTSRGSVIRGDQCPDLKVKAVLRNHLTGLMWKWRHQARLANRYRWFLVIANKRTNQIWHLQSRTSYESEVRQMHRNHKGSKTSIKRSGNQWRTRLSRIEQ